MGEDEIKRVSDVELGRKNPEPFGLRIVGEVNPKTLTKEQFSASSEILYHGSPKPFIFSPEFDYLNSEYCTNSDGSETLGQGFYSTAEKEIAENYSDVRKNSEDDRFVLEIIPFKAKMLDLRDKENLSRIVPVPKDLFDSWFYSFKKYFFEDQGRKNLPSYFQQMESEYFQHLVKLKNREIELKKVDFDLRVLLETSPFIPIHSQDYPSPFWMHRFSNFMQTLGYDGLIYIEGGEGEKRKNHTSFVFYNLSKIGTYESWQKL
ncbi:MAG: hypothetical protein Q7R97_04590 [Candidatus Daviesbacteria bacterium]|nr:hypothetical protein [Candidatus Daviesbacteria bacterium]